MPYPLRPDDPNKERLVRAKLSITRQRKLAPYLGERT